MGKRFTHKILSMFLALAVIVTYMPFASILGNSGTAYAASYSGTLKQSPTGNKLSGKAVEIKVVRYNSKMEKAEAYMDDGVCIESGEGEPIHKFEIATKSKDVLVYCVEHGVAHWIQGVSASCWKWRSSWASRRVQRSNSVFAGNMAAIRKPSRFAIRSGCIMYPAHRSGYRSPDWQPHRQQSEQRKRRANNDTR